MTSSLMHEPGLRDDHVVRGRVTTTVGGCVIVLSAVAATLAAAVPGRMVTSDGTQYGWNYSPEIWVLLAALTISGLVVIFRARSARATAVVAAILAAQVTGHGVVAVRDWFNANGASGMGQNNLATVVTFAAAVALSATVAAVTATAMVWREPADGWRGLIPARLGYVIAGAGVAVVLPLLLGLSLHNNDITLLGQTALTYSLPWGIGLTAAGWLRGQAATAARVTVALSAAMSTVVIAILVIRPG